MAPAVKGGTPSMESAASARLSRWQGARDPTWVHCCGALRPTPVWRSAVLLPCSRQWPRSFPRPAGRRLFVSRTQCSVFVLCLTEYYIWLGALIYIHDPSKERINIKKAKRLWEAFHRLRPEVQVGTHPLGLEPAHLPQKEFAQDSGSAICTGARIDYPLFNTRFFWFLAVHHLTSPSMRQTQSPGYHPKHGGGDANIGTTCPC